MTDEDWGKICVWLTEHGYRMHVSISGSARFVKKKRLVAINFIDGRVGQTTPADATGSNTSVRSS